MSYALPMRKMSYPIDHGLYEAVMGLWLGFEAVIKVSVTVDEGRPTRVLQWSVIERTLFLLSKR